jgi:hypothetical protein
MHACAIRTISGLGSGFRQCTEDVHLQIRLDQYPAAQIAITGNRGPRYGEIHVPHQCVTLGCVIRKPMETLGLKQQFTRALLIPGWR